MMVINMEVKQEHIKETINQSDQCQGSHDNDYYDRKINQLQEQISQISSNNILQSKKSDYFKKKLKIKPWYSDPGIWFAVVLVGCVFYGAFLVYANGRGYVISVPSWIADALNYLWGLVK